MVNDGPVLARGFLEPPGTAESDVSHPPDKGIHLQKQFHEPPVPRQLEEVAMDLLIGGYPALQIVRSGTGLHPHHKLFQPDLASLGAFASSQFCREALEGSICLFEAPDVLNG